MSVPAHAWERIFAKPAEHTQSRANTLRAAYENHLTTLGPNSHSPFIQTFRR